MSGVSVCNIDSAGGIIKPGSNSFVFYNGQPLAVVGCEVTPHGQHDRAVMETGSAILFINGIPVCIQGSRASCGHVATGRPNLTSSA